MKAMLVRFFVSAVILSFLSGNALQARQLVASGSFGAVSTGHPLATRTALKILNRGGNAVDAAIAAALVLGVVDPSNSGLGGDGFALVRMPDGRIDAIDAASPKPFDYKGNLSYIGIPTVPALLYEMSDRYSSRAMAELAAPAIATAKTGFSVSAGLANLIMNALPDWKDREAVEVFAPGGRPVRAGEILRQPILGATLESFAAGNSRTFYLDGYADIILKDINARGSSYSRDDFAAFTPKIKPPVASLIGEFKVLGNPPPSSSVAVIAMIEDLFALPEIDPVNPDPAVFYIMKKHLQIKYRYLAHSIRNPRLYFAIADQQKEFIPEPAGVAVEEAGRTTHLVTWDLNGMVVSMTLTLGRHFGSSDFSPLGFFYNNQVQNFGDHVSDYPENYPPDAGPVTAKSPIIVLQGDQPVLAIGGAGANRIIVNTAMVTASYLGHTISLAEAVHAPRFFPDHNAVLHGEWHPERVTPASSPWFIKRYQQRSAGDDFFGLISSVAQKDGDLLAVGDYRRDGSAGALQRSPDEPRSFIVDAVTWQKRASKEYSLANAQPSARQHVQNWKFPGKVKTNSFEDDPMVRTSFALKAPASAIRVQKRVTIFPGRNHNPSPAWNNPQLWLETIEHSRLEAEFLGSIPENLDEKDLVSYLMIAIGHGTPYRRIKGTIDARTLLDLGTGDSSRKARLFLLGARSRKLPCRLVGGVILNEGINETTHIWNEVFIDGSWVPVCTINHIYGRLPSNWLIMRYGDAKTLDRPGRIFFRVREETAPEEIPPYEATRPTSQ